MKRIDVQWVGKAATLALMFAFPFFLGGYADVRGERPLDGHRLGLRHPRPDPQLLRRLHLHPDLAEGLRREPGRAHAEAAP